MPSANEVLPAFFLSDDPDVVLAAAAAVEGFASGQVTTPEGYNQRTKKPECRGIHCARVFGPIADYSCICGRLSAVQHSGQICDRCGVLCGRKEVRGQRWGYIACGVPLIHPIVAPTIAEVLGCSVDDLVAVMRFQANLGRDGSVVYARRRAEGYYVFEDDAEEARQHRGNRYIAERLAELGQDHLLIHRIPVTPSDWRTTRRDPQDSRYMGFVNRCNRLARLMELAAPKIIIDNEERLTQVAFMRLGEVVRDELIARDNRRKPAPQTAYSQQLLARIAQAPDDLATRRRLADYLCEQNDPRGDFIVLQLDSTAPHRLSKAERDLLRWHYDAWLGPLVHAVDGAEFRRGFLFSCRTLREPAKATIGSPMWATVERLHTDLVELIVDPGMRALRVLSLSYQTLHSLCLQHTQLPQIERVEVRLARCPPRRVTVVSENSVLTGLRELELHVTSSRARVDCAWLLDTPLMERLDTLSLTMPLESLEDFELGFWWDVVAGAQGPRSVELCFHKRTLVFSLRGTSNVELEVRTSAAFQELIAMGNDELFEHYRRLLLGVARAHVGHVAIRARGQWFDSRLHMLADELRQHFGNRVTLPRLNRARYPETS